MRLNAKTVTVKVQRPLFSTGSMTEVLSYIVDENDEQISNDYVTEMPPQHIEQIVCVQRMTRHANWQPPHKLRLKPISDQFCCR